MNFQELIQKLGNRPTESELSNLTNNYTPVVRRFDEFLGFYLVEVEDGIAVLPFKEVVPGEGYGVFSLGKAELLTPKTEARTEYFRELINNSIKSLYGGLDSLPNLEETDVGADADWHMSEVTIQDFTIILPHKDVGNLVEKLNIACAKYSNDFSYSLKDTKTARYPVKRQRYAPTILVIKDVK